MVVFGSVAASGASQEVESVALEAFVFVTSILVVSLALLCRLQRNQFQ